MSKLSDIAADMRAAVAARPFGWVRQPLGDGLDIVLARNGEQWRLALGRVKVYPSDHEAAVCAPAFEVAEGTEPERRTYTRTDPKTGLRTTWHIVEFIWIERPDIKPAA